MSVAESICDSGSHSCHVSDLYYYATNDCIIFKFLWHSSDILFFHKLDNSIDRFLSFLRTLFFRKLDSSIDRDLGVAMLACFTYPPYLRIADVHSILSLQHWQITNTLKVYCEMQISHRNPQSHCRYWRSNYN